MLSVSAKHITAFQQPKVGALVIDYCPPVLIIPFLFHIWIFFNNNKLSSIQKQKRYMVYMKNLGNLRINTNSSPKEKEKP